MNLEDIMQSEVGQSMTFDWSNGLILIDHLAVVFPIVVVVPCIPQVITIHTKRQTTETSQQMTLLCTSIMLLLIVRVIDGQEYLIIIYCERCNLVWSHDELSRMSIPFSAICEQIIIIKIIMIWGIGGSECGPWYEEEGLKLSNKTFHIL